MVAPSAKIQAMHRLEMSREEKTSTIDELDTPKWVAGNRHLEFRGEIGIGDL